MIYILVKELSHNYIYLKLSYQRTPYPGDNSTTTIMMILNLLDIADYSLLVLWR
jgi:hypothetical protein